MTDQLGGLRAQMLANVASRVILRTEEPDASLFARQYPQSGLSAADISNQPARQHQYAVLALESGAKSVLSMVPNPWPTPEPNAGAGEPDRPWWYWRLPLPEMDSAEEADVRLRTLEFSKLIYEPCSAERYAELVQQLSAYPREEWEALLAQWEQVRRTHYQLLCDKPEAVPDQMRRLAWLSRLETRIPGLLVDAQFVRMTKRSAVASEPPPQRSGRMPRARRGEAEATTTPRPASNAIIPGLAAESAPEQPLQAAGPSAEVLLRQRGRRPSAQDVAAGYDFAAEEPRDGQS